MRDLFVLLVVAGSLPVILLRPWIGVLVWSWLGYMNPHRLSWGFAVDFPFAQVVALVTMVALLASREPKKIPWTRESITLLVFILWMCVTTIFAVYQELALLQLQKVLKIQIMVFITMMVINTRGRIDALVWVIALSLGFYGIKGGIFTVTTGGGHHVRGPNGTFIGGNNEIGLALIMTIPLIRYLYLCATRWWLKRGLGAAIVLTLIAILGTQSRGAFLGLGAMLFFMLIKSRKRVMFVVVMAMAVPVALSVMPQSWYDRMHSIRDYEQDASAQGRLWAWKFATQTAIDRPLGGGFEVFAGRTDAHSIYFEILGEHGFGGLLLFLLLWIFTWRTASWVIRKARGSPDLAWANDLSRMIQVSLVGYAASGVFLGLAYFDLTYHLMALVVVTRVVVEKSFADERQLKLAPSTIVQSTKGVADIR